MVTRERASDFASERDDERSREARMRRRGMTFGTGDRIMGDSGCCAFARGAGV